MRENFKSGSVRGLIVTSEPILQYEVDYEPYSTFNIFFKKEREVMGDE
jgi:hypothetical protein